MPFGLEAPWEADGGENENDISLHWTSGASAPQARGVTSGNLNMVSFST